MIYIHIPFCRRFCKYCGFYSELLSRSRELSELRMADYVDRICDEAESRKDEILSTMPSDGHPQNVDTLYIGGGTPSVLPPVSFSCLVQSVNYSVWGSAFHDYEEFTVEVNPDDIIKQGIEYVRDMVYHGVNRISMGVQSFDDGMLQWMNRRHSAADAVKAYGILREAGLRNISIDLIFGIDSLTDEMWETTIDKALSLAPEHISAYQLSIEQGSALARLCDRGKYSEMPDERCRAQYDMLCRKLAEAGYHHYEVSNFALPGHEAVHNSAYWVRVPYVGLGAGAHSALLGEDGVLGVRSWNSEDEAGYDTEREILTAEDVRVEQIMLNLRTDKGIEAALLPSDAMERLISEGALRKIDGGRVRIPEDRFFVSDEIIRELI